MKNEKSETQKIQNNKHEIIKKKKKKVHPSQSSYTYSNNDLI